MNTFCKAVLFLFAFSCNSLTAQNNFVTQQQQKLMLNKRPYHFIGANMWYANLLAMPDNKGGNRKRLLKELDFLQQQGVTNIRVLIGAQGQNKLVNSVNPVHPALQTAPAIYNDDLLLGMDFLLQQLQKRKMYGVFFFSNNWEWSGGFLQYLNWHNKLDDATMAKKLSWDENRDIVSGFYSCSECKEDYWNFVKHILQRTNSITQKKYIEPRPMRPEAIDAYKDFLKQTAVLIKTADDRHLLTIGVEGYMGTENMEVFEAIHNDKNVDYATIHIWPKNWGWYKDSTFATDFETVVNKTSGYISEHAAVMQRLKKPLVVEEFGLPRDNFSFSLQSPIQYRDKYFLAVMQLLVKSKKENTAIAGINFWSFSGFGRPAKNADPFWKEGDDLLGDPPMEEQGLNSVFAGDSSTWKIIRQNIKGIKN
jgi:mannan endo-1,4-beta-mannosidase